MTPIQGDWKISSIGLPPAVLRKVYFDNARKLLASSMPPPLVQARRLSRELDLEGHFDDMLWQTAKPVRIEQSARDGTARPELSTTVRALWSPQHLYLAYECPFTRLTVFQPPQSDRKRFDLSRDGVSLWDRDIVEAFIGADPERPRRYAEFEVAPTNERLDVMVLNPPAKDFAWTSHFQSAVQVDPRAKVWKCELRIPLSALAETLPTAGTRWRLNLLRRDLANHAGLAWSPPLSGTFHVPERLGVLEFVE